MTCKVLAVSGSRSRPLGATCGFFGAVMSISALLGGCSGGSEMKPGQVDGAAGGNGGVHESGGDSGGGMTGSGGLLGSGGVSVGGTAGGRSGGASGSGGTSGIAGSGGGTGGVAGSGGSGGRGGAGGSDGGVGGSGTGGSSGASLTALASAFCATARTCCAGSSFSTTLDDCEAKFQSRVPALAFVNKGTVTIDNTALAACIDGYNQVATTCTMSSLAAACKGVFVGTKAEGAPCGVGGVPMVVGVPECKSNGGAQECVWTGDSNDPTVTGVCRTPVHGKSGDSCASSCVSAQDCEFDLLTSSSSPTAVCFEDDGLYCNFATNPSTCTPIVGLAGSCATDPSSCGSTATCDSTTSKCKAAATLGQSCSYTGGDMCLSALVCNSAGKCAAPGLAYEGSCSGTPPYPY